MANLKFLPDNINIAVEKGYTILDAAIENNVIIEHNCGGVGACTSCKVRILNGSNYLNKKSADESFMLSGENLVDEDIRLSCQCIVLADSGEEIIIEIL